MQTYISILLGEWETDLKNHVLLDNKVSHYTNLQSRWSCF
jgi:hypothetical protein